MRYFIEEFKESDSREWNEFVNANKELTIFHTVEWKKIMEETFGFKPAYYVVKTEDKEIVGVCPAFIVKEFFKKAIVSMPFFEYGGPFIKEGYKEAYKDLFKVYKSFVDEKKVKYVKIRSLPSDADYGETGFNKELEAYSFFISLKDKSFDDVWNSFTKDSGVRTEYNRSVRFGVEVKNQKNPEVIYKLISAKDAKLGSPTFPKKFYVNVDKHLKTRLFYTNSMLKENPIASMTSLSFNGELLLHQLGSDKEYMKKTSTDILFVEQIKRAINTGCLKIDFGRSKPGSSHSFFKKKYDCERRDIYTYTYPESFSEDRYEGRSFGSKIIKSFPFIFTKTFIGAWLRKNVAL